MSAHADRPHQRGIILVAVLLAVAIMSVMVVAAAALTRAGVGSEELEQRRLASHFALRSAVEAAKAVILAMPPDARLGLDGTAMPLDLGNGILTTVTLRDAAGLADLNRSEPKLVEAVATFSGLPRAKAETIAATLTKLRKDAEPAGTADTAQARPASPATQPGGSAASAAATAKDAPPLPIIFLALEQFVDLLGLPPDDGGRLASVLTVYNPSGLINPLAAPAPVLQSVPGISPRELADVAMARKTGGGASDPRLQQLAQRLPELLTLQPPRVFLLEVRIDSGGPVLEGSRARAVLRLSGEQDPLPFGTLALEEE